MRGRLLVIAIGCAAFVGFATAQQQQQLQPLNVKTGLWLITKAVTWTNLPPQMAYMMRAPQQMTYNSCVTAQNLTSNPWAEGSGDRCVWTVLNSTGTDMEVQATGCSLGNGMTAQVHGHIHILDSQDGTGSMTLAVNAGSGQTFNGQATYTGKWVNSTCPAH
jgi:hypothetical protein